jgi:aminopeptidase N
MNVALDLDPWMESWLQTSGINTLEPVVEGNSLSIKQSQSKVGDVNVLREQMIDVAVLKLTKVAGVTEDQWDEEGDMELSHKMEVEHKWERILVKAQEVTPNVLELASEPAAILVNYRNYGYCRMRFDAKSRECLIKNLKYITKSGDRTYVWRTFRDMIHNNDMTIAEWYTLIDNNLEFETEEQTLSVILSEILYTWRHGLLTDE